MQIFKLFLKNTNCWIKFKPRVYVQIKYTVLKNTGFFIRDILKEKHNSLRQIKSLINKTFSRQSGRSIVIVLLLTIEVNFLNLILFDFTKIRGEEIKIQTFI